MNEGAGVVIVVHVEPFHRSTRFPDVVCDSHEPTATQALVAEHETLDRSLKMAAGPFGLATVDHVVPFHLRTSVFVPELPTAKQVVGCRAREVLDAAATADIAVRHRP